MAVKAQEVLEITQDRDPRGILDGFTGDPALSRNLVRLALICGIIAWSTSIARSGKNEGPVSSALAFALPGIGIPLIAADAGITDKYALAGISAAGVGYVTGQMIEGWFNAGILPDKADIWGIIKDFLPEWMIPG